MRVLMRTDIGQIKKPAYASYFIVSVFSLGISLADKGLAPTDTWISYTDTQILSNFILKTCIKHPPPLKYTHHDRRY